MRLIRPYNLRALALDAQLLPKRGLTEPDLLPEPMPRR